MINFYIRSISCIIGDMVGLMNVACILNYEEDMKGDTLFFLNKYYFKIWWRCTIFESLFLC